VGHSVALVDEETKAAIARQDALLHRRTLLNYILVSAAAGGAAAMLSQPSQPANAFPFGPSAASLEGPKTTEALDRAGQPIVASQFLATKSGGERTMVQGLKSDPTYLIVTAEGGGLEPYAINAECTHLGCLVPWDPIQKKFECPCHGSQYDARGSVIRGPAPGPLKLAKVSTEEETGCILLENWSDADFRTGEKPWWV
jgi:cytochrome b6-f complex iron-sulfur subunit